MALGIIGVDKIVIVQNKIDIVDPKQAEENYRQIQAFVKGTVAEGAPIVPVSAHHDVNLDALLMMIQKVIPTPPHDESKIAKMYVARSFDVNQPGIVPEKIVGGVLGGSLMQGRMKVGEEIEISPGRQVTLGNKTEWKNITTTIRSLHTGGSGRKEVRPGGLIAIGTNLDPVLTKADGLVGRVVGPPASLPEILMKMTVEVNLLERVVGVPEELKVEGIKTSEPLMVSVGTATTVGVVTSARENRADMALKIPVVAEPGQRVAVSRRIGGKWRLIGYGVLMWRRRQQADPRGAPGRESVSCKTTKISRPWPGALLPFPPRAPVDIPKRVRLHGRNRCACSTATRRRERLRSGWKTRTISGTSTISCSQETSYAPRRTAARK